MDAMAKKLLRYCAFLATVGLLTLAACSSKPGLRAPVEDRGRVATQTSTPTPEVSAAPANGPAVVVDSNAGKPGYYTVKQGDTLIRIGLESGQSHRDLARWNALENPNRIEIGQVLRVVPPEEAVVAKPVVAAKVVTAPLAPASAASSPAKPASASAQTAGSATPADDDISFAWPAKGDVLDGFDEAKNRKGVDIGGASGDAVLAAADGKVVYADAGLRGYGKLIIVKHNSLFLTAYAHNQTLLVKEDQTVKKGQKIAEMGSTDADRVKLHFEVRKQGKPVDPAKYLPAR
jgi:lipoprotein NlpD